MPGLTHTECWAEHWSKLPQGLRHRLGQASTGWRHLAGIGGEAARLRALAADILLWAHGENPLYGPLAAEILAASGLPPLPEAARASLAAVAARWHDRERSQRLRPPGRT